MRDGPAESAAAFDEVFVVLPVLLDARFGVDFAAPFLPVETFSAAAFFAVLSLDFAFWTAESAATDESRPAWAHAPLTGSNSRLAVAIPGSTHHRRHARAAIVAIRSIMRQGNQSDRWGQANRRVSKLWVPDA